MQDRVIMEETEPIISLRVGFEVSKKGFDTRSPYSDLYRHRASWPLGRLNLYRDHLRVGTVLQEFCLPYSEIQRVTKCSFQTLQIEHKNASVPELVYVRGWFLPSTLQETVQRASIPLDLDW